MVGEMDEELFIDNVDLDWCFRASDRDLELRGVADARMDHRIGDRRSGVLGVAQVAHHPPARLYFIMRNRVALYRRSHTPLAWIAQDIPRVAVKLVTFGVFLGPALDQPAAHGAGPVRRSARASWRRTVRGDPRRG